MCESKEETEQRTRAEALMREQPFYRMSDEERLLVQRVRSKDARSAAYVQATLFAIAQRYEDMKVAGADGPALHETLGEFKGTLERYLRLLAGPGASPDKQERGLAHGTFLNSLSPKLWQGTVDGLLMVTNGKVSGRADVDILIATNDVFTKVFSEGLAEDDPRREAFQASNDAANATMRANADKPASVEEIEGGGEGGGLAALMAALGIDPGTLGEPPPWKTRRGRNPFEA